MTPIRATALLIGRTNVGKSTLFNRLSSTTRAIVGPTPGTTRDRTLGLVNWQGKNFWLSDAPGFIAERNQITQTAIIQLKKVIPEAGIILFVIDGQTGLTNLDLEIAKLLRRLKAPVILVINKIDSPRWRANENYNTLGFTNTVLVSAKNGSGIGDLLDMIVRYLPTINKINTEFTLGIIGKTNVGKSSLFNTLLQNERSLVSPTEHTTRDSQLDYLNFNNVSIGIIDTAGIRRQLPRASIIERQSVAQSFNTISQVSVVALILDASKELSWQDQRLAGLIAESGKACLIIINKVDLISAEQKLNFDKNITSYLPMLNWAPRLWVSALTKQGVNHIIKNAGQAVTVWRSRFSPKNETDFLNHLRRTKPTSKFPLTLFTQNKIEPPQFTLNITTKERLPSAIAQAVERELRRKFNFTGTPLRVYLEGVTRGSAGKKLWVRPHKPYIRRALTTG